MPNKRVLILSSHSLFAEGIASRLLELSAQLEISFIDPRHLDLSDQIKAVEPTVIILDASDPNMSELCPIHSLFALRPTVKIIRLDSQREDIQVLTSRSFQAAKVSDLYDIIMEPDLSVPL